MVYAVILRPPKPGAKLAGFDASDASGMYGFLDAKALPNDDGVVVYASSTWAAIQARKAITAEWDYSAAETRSTAEIAAAFVASAGRTAIRGAARGGSRRDAGGIVGRGPDRERPTSACLIWHTHRWSR